MKTPAHNRQSKQNAKPVIPSGIVIKLDGKEFVYDHIKIVAQSAPVIEQRIEKIVALNSDPDVSVPASLADEDAIVRVVKIGQLVFVLSGRKQIEHLVEKGEKIVRARLVSLNQLMRCEVPAKKIEVTAALSMLAMSDKFKVKPAKATSTPIKSIGQLGDVLNKPGVRNKTGFYQSRQNTAT